MKRAKSLIICLLLLATLFLSSCQKSAHFHLYYHGFDRFNIHNSDYGLSMYLIPTDFIAIFPCLEGDYEYHVFSPSEEYELLYFRYSDDTYEDAKQFFIDNMTLSQEDFPEYASFSFHRIIGFFRDYEDPSPDKDPTLVAYRKFPYAFTMVAFSDEKKVIVAFGQYRRPLVIETDDWSVFLAAHFPVFDWDAARMMEESEP